MEKELTLRLDLALHKEIHVTFTTRNTHIMLCESDASLTEIRQQAIAIRRIHVGVELAYRSLYRS